jgi:Rv2632c-like
MTNAQFVPGPDAIGHEPIPTAAKSWTVEILIDEFEGKTRAHARLHTADVTRIVGTGLARRNPADTDIPEIGDELAAARALSDLAHALLDAAAGDIEAVTHRAARLHG